MIVIASGRKTSRTTQLIEMAQQRGGIIVCHSHEEAHRVAKKARELGTPINFPLSYSEFIKGEYRPPLASELYVDNVEKLLQQLARNVPIYAATILKEPLFDE